MLEGQIRESISKSQAKALRNDGYLIANIYGKGQQNIHCAFKLNDFIKAMKQKTTLIFPVHTGFLRKWKYLEKKLKKFFIKMDRFLWTKFGD